MLSIPGITDNASGDVRKRRAMRQRIGTLIYADLGPGNGGFPLNISEFGMAFQGIQPLEIGQIISLKLKLPDRNEVVESSGQVIWLNNLGKGGGLEFIGLAAESRRLISDWLSLQSDPSGQIEAAQIGGRPCTPREIGKKELRFTGQFPGPPPADRQGRGAPKADLNLLELFSSSSLKPVAIAATTANAASTAKKLTPGSASQGKSEPATRKSESEWAWIIPFTIGLITSAAVMVAAMIIFGVISIQFHWPHPTAAASTTGPLSAPEIGSAKLVDSPPAKISLVDSLSDASLDKSLPEPTPESILAESMSDRPSAGLAAPTPPSTASAKTTIVKLVAPKVTAPEPSPARMTSTPKVELPKTLPQPPPAAKVMAPAAIPPARTVDVLPPTVAFPTEPGFVPRLSASSPGRPVSSPALKTDLLDAPVLIQRKDPVYSKQAKEERITGSVELHFTVSAQGNVRDVSVIKGNPLLARAAVDAIQAWHYQPARRNGIPVATEASAVFNFKPN